MARIAEEEVERIKEEIALVRVVEAAGIELKPHGSQDLVGRCPFHDDKTPSLVVSPDKNLWHCLGACQTGGSVIDWVMKAEAISFRHAVELLREQHFPSLVADPERRRGGRPASDGRTYPKQSATKKLPSFVEPDEGDAVLMKRVVEYYQEQLRQSPEAMEYLKSRGLGSAELLSHFKVGFSNRTLGYRLPAKQWKAGKELRSRLQKLGVLRGSGHEHFNGSVVFPIFDERGEVVEMYGRKITKGLRPGTPLHLYLPGPHRGVWNLEAIKASKEVILCESIVDAATFWCAGLRNVTCAYGVNGFTDDHLHALQEHDVERVVIAYDRDDAGDKAAEALSKRLNAVGIETGRVLFPKGMDANEYALKVTPADKSLRLAVQNAVWTGKGRSVSVPLAVQAAAALGCEASDNVDSRTPEASKEVSFSHLAAEAGATVEERWDGGEPPEKLSSLAAQQGPKTVIDETESSGRVSRGDGDELVLTYGDRRWRIRGLSKNTAPSVLKVNLLVSRGDAFHVDALELYSARQRAAFVAQAREELQVEERVIKGDLGRVLLKLEELQEQQLKDEKTPSAKTVALSESDQKEALSLLKDPKLLERILGDFERCGVIGERVNKLVGYLAATSRKLEKPLAVVIQSTSAAGKSSLMEAILEFVPEEERCQYSAMTERSLFYMGGQDLKHKVLAIAEEEGAREASYALKLLQSEGRVKIASTGKDARTGEFETREYELEGPVMVFLTTTAIDIDEELLNRCLVLSVDEGREQTRAIHAAQRRARTLEGLVASQERSRLKRLHQNAQRLLRPLSVVNPYAAELRFPDHQTRARRDHTKYLAMIDSVVLLHQYQREVKEVEHRGAKVRYIEVTRADIELADELCREVLQRTMDELPPGTRRLLLAIERLVVERSEQLGVDRNDYRFSRREVREWTTMGMTQLRVHLERLVEMEFLLAHGSRGRGSQQLYELAWYAEPESSTDTTASWRGDDGGLAGRTPSTSSSDKASHNQDLAAESAEVGGAAGGTRYRRRVVEGVNGASHVKLAKTQAAAVQPEA